MYLPNLTAFKKSSRRWITDLIFKDFAKKSQCAAQAIQGLAMSTMLVVVVLLVLVVLVVVNVVVV